MMLLKENRVIPKYRPPSGKHMPKIVCPGTIFFADVRWRSTNPVPPKAIILSSRCFATLLQSNQRFYQFVSEIGTRCDAGKPHAKFRQRAMKVFL